MQVFVTLRLLKRLSAKLGTPAVVLCGDFNSPPNFPPYEFLQNGSLHQETRNRIQGRGEILGQAGPCVFLGWFTAVP